MFFREDVPMDAAVGTLPVILVSGGLLFLGFILGWLSSTKAAHSKIHRAESTAEQLIEDAKLEAESMKRTSLLEARDQMHEEQIDFERKQDETQGELKRRQNDLGNLSRQLEKRADLLNHKEETILLRDEDLTAKEEAVQAERSELQHALQEHQAGGRSGGFGARCPERLQSQVHSHRDPRTAAVPWHRVSA